MPLEAKGSDEIILSVDGWLEKFQDGIYDNSFATVIHETAATLLKDKTIDDERERVKEFYNLVEAYHKEYEQVKTDGTDLKGITLTAIVEHQGIQLSSGLKKALEATCQALKLPLI